ncbi:Heat shock factor protein [Wickerhamomyces ciferrii]|uniref:Heat shock transcription factor n=1 Tax=Wickerhamomyces ciferrii (strain ATCC 14091 / BCRC 22168 / CBS 111 / JCM 3599 / NBRC 0793 / NRRL Y-1031 F-60-10) TaxID=1206466 RepID=K0KQF5_WICCF|nr:Heat shock factor protein [Wickerhamomyces ciferrii]CCH43483.1 Heat shock factor protein [Wickerhamomyces ciferrii]
MSNADDLAAGNGFLFHNDVGADDDLLNIGNIGSLIPPQALEPQQDHHITQLPEDHSTGSSMDDGIPIAAASVEQLPDDETNNNQLAPYSNNHKENTSTTKKKNQDPNYLALSTKNNNKSTSKKSKSTKSKPAFVLKIWSMVNDETNNDLIKWYQDGNSFIVTNRESFVQQILPKYFKHSNFASFVRQLNMYGWHKVQDASSGSLHSDEKWQFENKNFIRGKPELLDKIVRNKPNEDLNNGNGSMGNNSNDSNLQFDVNLLIHELNQLKSNQQKITQELSRVRSDNELLWQELFSSREKNLVQNDKIEKILQFLASVYGNKLPTIEHNLGLSAHNAYLQNNPTTSTFYNPYQTNPNTPQPSSSSTSTTNNGVVDYNSNNSNPNTMNKPPTRTRLMISQHRHVSNSNSNTPNSEDSPIQEIARTPNNFQQQQPFTPNYSIGTPQGFNNNSPYNNQYLPSDDFQNSNPSINQQLNHAQQQLHQAQQQQAQLRAQQQQVQQQQQQQQQVFNQQQQGQQMQGQGPSSDRPNVTTHQPSFDDLSRTIEEQGQSINDIISRIQQGQPNNQEQSSNNNNNNTQQIGNGIEQYETSSTSSSNNNPNTFDLDDFLNQEVYLPQEDPTTTIGGTGGSKLGKVHEIYDANDDDDDDEDIEEIINPSKKRKNYKR